MKILAIQNRMGIGDMVIFLPFIEAISKKFNSPVSILVKENSKALEYLEKNKYIEKISNDITESISFLIKKKLDYTMSAISGLDGLKPTISIIKSTKNIAIANKESIICGWNLIDNELNKNIPFKRF